MIISNAGYFKPNARQLRVEMIQCGIPEIYVSPIANAKMQHYVDIVSDEVGWLGTVEELDTGDYLISDVYLFEQRVSGGTTEITEDALADFAQEVLQQEDGMEIMNKLRFWGHSHVMMPTSPSGQDDDQMETFSSCGHDFFIRGIFNKKGEVNFSIYNYSSGVVFHHVDWKLYTEEHDDLRQEIEEEISRKVTKKYEGHVGHLPSSNYYPRGGYTLPYNNREFDQFDDYSEDNAHYETCKGHSDEAIQEMTQEEYDDLIQRYRNDIDTGTIPDDPQKYKYGRK